MGGLRLGLAAAATLAVFPALPGHATPAHVHVHVVNQRAQLVALARGRTTPHNAAQVRQRYLTVARARLELAGAVGGGSATAEAFGPVAIAAPVKDVSGHTDVAVLTIPTGQSASTLSVRDGRNGRQLWTRSLDDAWAFDVARLGAAHRPTLVVYETSFTGASDPLGVVDDGEQSNSIVTLDVSTGQLVWASTPVVGTYSVSPMGFTEVNALYPAGVLHDRAGDRLLATKTTDGYGFFTSSGQAQDVIYDGVTGAESSTVSIDLGDADQPRAAPAGDVNGDGRDDWYAFVDGDVASVRAISGATGTPLWAKPLPAGGFIDVQPTGDLNHDGHPDVVVGTSSLGESEGTLTAYAGATGATLMTHPGDGAEDLGVIGSEHVILDWDLSGFGAVSVSALTGAGKVLWTRTVSIPIAEGESGGGGMEAGTAGDVDGDGVQDVYVDMTYATTHTAGSATVVVSGRSGRATSGRAIGRPLGFSLDGKGDDFLDALPGAHSWQMTAYDGRRRHKLWTWRQPVQDKGFLLDVASLPSLRRGAMADFYDGRRTHVFGLLGATGHRVWDAII